MPTDQDMLKMYQTLRAKMEIYAPDLIEDKFMTEGRLPKKDISIIYNK